MKPILQLLAFLLLAPLLARAQVNTGSTGADGAFNPTTSTNINMADHPNGIYHYTSVNIPANVVVSFTPNAANTPVVWLVQSNCVITGQVSVSAGSGAGPGGFSGGGTSGKGPGGGGSLGFYGAGASYGSLGSGNNGAAPGITYGNTFLIPLFGGSGGGSGNTGFRGGDGGGAILIAAPNTITLDGAVYADGSDGSASGTGGYSGGGSGGGIRFVTLRIVGIGYISANGGNGHGGKAGLGRVRFDTYDNAFGGSITGVFSQGFQPLITPGSGQGIQLVISSVAGAPVAASPSGTLVTPDALISGQQANPITIVVRCINLPLNTPVTVTVQPANGPAISAVGYNNTGTLASSTATVNLIIPRGGGFISAIAGTGN